MAYLWLFMSTEKSRLIARKYRKTIRFGDASGVPFHILVTATAIISTTTMRARPTLGDGWYLPNEEQMTALLQQFRFWDIGGSLGQVGLQYPVGDQTLYMPYCGKIVNDADQLCGKEGFYWIKQANNSESKYIWLHDGSFSVESGDRSDRMTVRPIHDLHEI